MKMPPKKHISKKNQTESCCKKNKITRFKKRENTAQKGIFEAQTRCLEKERKAEEKTRRKEKAK